MSSVYDAQRDPAIKPCLIGVNFFQLWFLQILLKIMFTPKKH